jgi:hypothetical protein
MKKAVSLVSVAISIFTLSVIGCSDNNTATVRIDLGGISHAKVSQPWYNSILNILTLSKPSYAARPSGITAVWVEVTAADLAPFNVYADAAADYIEIPNIPAGKNRTFSVVASGMSSMTQSFYIRAHGGTVAVDLKAGESKDLDIVMGLLPVKVSGYEPSANEDGAIYLSWYGVFTGNDSTRIYRKYGSGEEFSFLTDVVSTNEYYTEQAPTFETDIVYKLVPYNSFGFGESIEVIYHYIPPLF